MESGQGIGVFLAWFENNPVVHRLRLGEMKDGRARSRSVLVIAWSLVRAWDMLTSAICQDVSTVSKKSPLSSCDVVVDKMHNPT